MRVRAERPPWYLSVVGGALYVRNKLIFFFNDVTFYVIITSIAFSFASLESIDKQRSNGV